MNIHYDLPALNAIAIKLTQDQVTLIDIEDYDLVKEFRWCAHRTRNGWAVVTQIDETVNMSCLIMNPPHDMLVDHKDGNGLHNRRLNLRICTRSQNNCNRGPRMGTSKFKGVSWDRHTRKWIAKIGFNGKQTYLGLFEDEIEAALTYDEAATRLHDEFAWLNFPIEEGEG